MRPNQACTLSICGREVARSDFGPLEAEYALFDADAIELRRGEGQTIHEVGYRTTGGEAKERLRSHGVTIELATRAAVAMHHGLAEFYARGPFVRRVATTLGARELFDGRLHLSEAGTYEGVWLDLGVLANDLGKGAAVALQLFHLVAHLDEVADDAEVFLSTSELSGAQRSGYRSYRRISMEGMDAWTVRIAALAARSSGGTLHESGPTRVEILDEIEANAANATPAARERIALIERASAVVRPAPDRGPLSDPAAWSIEAQISTGDLAGAIKRISVMEQTQGAIPSLVYLKSRVSLIMAREQPRVIAERVANLAAKNSFVELELLAAEAWAACGEMGRALPHARVLVSNRQVHEEVRSHALRIVRAAERGDQSVPPRGRISLSQGSMRSVKGPVAVPAAARETVRPMEVEPTSHPRTITHDYQRPLTTSTPGHAWARENVAAYNMRGSNDVTTMETAPPPTPRVSSLDRNHSPLPLVLDLELAGSVAAKALRQSPLPDVQESGVHPSARPAALPSSNPPDPHFIPTEPPPRVSNNHASSNANGERESLMHPTANRGASRPAFRAIPRRNTPLHLSIGLAEIAEHLSDPPIEKSSYEGISATRMHDVRTQFTEMSRQLGARYRTEQSIELRMDVGSIEAVQTVLRERYSRRGIRAEAEALDVLKHGAFVSEILARTLGAQWVDVESDEHGHWAMIVPTHVRVWPIGRVLRLIALGDRERDLVSYYLELAARSS